MLNAIVTRSVSCSILRGDTMPTVHVNSRWVDTSVYDLDVYDKHTLREAIQSLAWHINFWMARDKPDKAQPYIEGKQRIKKYLGVY